jgi:archaellum component FlaF (FlaF/FlaG flagellin family)
MQHFPAESYLFEIELHLTHMLLNSVSDSTHVTVTVNGSMRAALPEADLMIYGTRI